VLRECIADRYQSKFLKEVVEQMLSRQSLQVDGNESKLLQLISMRQCLLDHMVSLYSCHSSTGEGSERNSVRAPVLAHFAECVGFGLQLTSDLRKLQKASYALLEDVVRGCKSVSALIASAFTHAMFLLGVWPRCNHICSFVTGSNLLEVCLRRVR
jgi:hypothetical protein